MSVHTTAGCTQPQGVTQSGTQITTNCDYNQNGNSGCTVQDPNTASYGAAFAQAGGGVWVTEFAETGINIWFFSVRTVPPNSVICLTDIIRLHSGLMYLRPCPRTASIHRLLELHLPAILPAPVILLRTSPSSKLSSTSSFAVLGVPPLSSIFQAFVSLTMLNFRAGYPSALQATCPALQPKMTCYTTYVINNNSNYNEAYCTYLSCFFLLSTEC
jgi:hypothetical protein